MQIDMHYCGVYAMARAAGLTTEASGRIATASELVDDNAEEEHVEFGDGGRLGLIPTAHCCFALSLVGPPCDLT